MRKPGGSLMVLIASSAERNGAGTGGGQSVGASAGESLTFVGPAAWATGAHRAATSNRTDNIPAGWRFKSLTVDRDGETKRRGFVKFKTSAIQVNLTITSPSSDAL